MGKQTFNKIIVAFMNPIVRNLPFILVYVLPTLLYVAQEVHGIIVSDNPTDYPPTDIVISQFFAVFFQAYILAAIISCSQKKWIKVLVYTFTFILFAFSVFIKQQYSLDIGPLVITLLAETNSSESGEFIRENILSLSSTKVYVYILLYITFAIVLERLWHKVLNKNRLNSIGGGGTVASTIVFVAFLYGFSFNIYYIYCVNRSLSITLDKYYKIAGNVKDPVNRLIYSAMFLHQTGENMEVAVERTRNIGGNTFIKDPKDSLNVILVIGESYIKSHAQLYGYSLPTTPNMCAEEKSGNLFAFTDVCTPYSHTTEAIRNILCTNSVGLGEEWYTEPYVPSIFKRAGFHVMMWDNQKNDGEFSVYTFTLNGFLYNPEICRLSYNQMNKKSYTYDEELISSFKKEAKLNNKFNFAILHLIGQHSMWSDRYPHTQDNCKFTYKDVHSHAPYLTDAKRKDIAYYDNATLYNDKVMESIFSMFKNKNAFVVYIPDHGEEVFDWRDSEGRVDGPMCSNLLKYQFDVPFIVWCSDIYIKKNPRVVSLLKKSLTHPFESDNTCQILFHLAGLWTKYYDMKRDPINLNYIKPKRIVNGNLDYDAIRWQQNNGK